MCCRLPDPLFHSGQDTPGYGDSTDLEADRQVILDYITGCSRRHLEQERDPARHDPIHSLPDSEWREQAS